MAHRSNVSRTLLASTLLGSLALAVPIASVPATARASAPMSRGADLPKLDLAPKKVRVVMDLRVETTTDATEVGMPLASNTEDEIFYSLAGARSVGGKEAAFLPTEVRPSGARDIWEMGSKSNETLTRTLFEGDLSPSDRAVLTVAIGEQDNAQREALVNLFKSIASFAGGALEKELSSGDPHGSFKGAIKEEMVGDAMALVEAIGKRDDQIVGVLAISASRGSLKVTGGEGMFSKVSASDGKSATLELSGYGGRYTVELRLEEVANAPRPATAVFLSQEFDKCSEGILEVGGKKIKKGQTVEVKVPKPRFDWRCGGALEHTTAPAPTNMVKVERAASGRDITWRTFFVSTPAPDFSW